MNRNRLTVRTNDTALAKINHSHKWLHNVYKARVSTGDQSDKPEHDEEHILDQKPLVGTEVVRPGHAQLHDSRKSDAHRRKAKGAEQRNEQAQPRDGNRQNNCTINQSVKFATSPSSLGKRSTQRKKSAMKYQTAC